MNHMKKSAPPKGIHHYNQNILKAMSGVESFFLDGKDDGFLKELLKGDKDALSGYYNLKYFFENSKYELNRPEVDFTSDLQNFYPTQSPMHLEFHDDKDPIELSKKQFIELRQSMADKPRYEFVQQYWSKILSGKKSYEAMLNKIKEINPKMLSLEQQEKLHILSQKFILLDVVISSPNNYPENVSDEVLSLGFINEKVKEIKDKGNQESFPLELDNNSELLSAQIKAKAFLNSHFDSFDHLKLKYKSLQPEIDVLLKYRESLKQKLKSFGNTTSSGKELVKLESQITAINDLEKLAHYIGSHPLVNMPLKKKTNTSAGVKVFEKGTGYPKTMTHMSAHQKSKSRDKAIWSDFNKKLKSTINNGWSVESKVSKTKPFGNIHLKKNNKSIDIKKDKDGVSFKANDNSPDSLSTLLKAVQTYKESHDKKAKSSLVCEVIAKDKHQAVQLVSEVLKQNMNVEKVMLPDKDGNLKAISTKRLAQIVSEAKVNSSQSKSKKKKRKKK